MTSTAKPNSDFFIYCKKGQEYLDRSTDYLIKSFKYKHNSVDWKILRLFKIKYEKVGIKYLKKANKILQHGGF